MANKATVQSFLEELSITEPDKFDLISTLRMMVLESYPKALEIFKYGGIIFNLEEDFSGIFVYKNHISLEFSKGYTMKDENRILEGGGKYRRHLKIRSLQDIKDKKVAHYVKQAI